jgi:hypothetical protein
MNVSAAGRRHPNPSDDPNGIMFLLVSVDSSEPENGHLAMRPNSK